MTTGCALAAALLVSTTQPRVQYPTLTLDLQSMAKVSTGVLEEGKATLTRIYQAAGIRVQWSTAGADFIVTIRFPPHPEAVRNSRFALGYAPHDSTGRGHLAFVLADRIEATARGLGVAHHAGVWHRHGARGRAPADALRGAFSERDHA